MNTTNTATDFDQMVIVQNISVAAKRELIQSLAQLGFIMIGVCALFSIMGFEYSLAFHLMNEMFGPEVPGVATPLNVIILAAATIMGVIAFEVLHARQPDNLALRLMIKAAPYLLLVFFIGMALLFAVSEIAGPTDTGPIVLSEDDLLGDSAGSDEGLLAGFAIHFGSLALGMMVLVNLVVVHLIVSKLRETLPTLSEELQLAWAKRREAKRYMNDTRLQEATQRELEELKAITPQQQAREAAADIEAQVLPVLRRLNELKHNRDNASKPKTGPLAKRDPKLPHPMPDQATLDAFVKEVEEKIAKLPGELTKLFQKT